MIQGFDVEGVIMSKLRGFFEGGGGWESKSIVSREIDSRNFFSFFLSCESCKIKGTCSRNLFQFCSNFS